MKILIVYPYFGTPSGSWSTRMYELTKRWANEEINVEVITAPYEKSDIKSSKFYEKRIIENIDLSIINCADSNRIPFIWRAFKSIVFAVVTTFLVLFKRYDVLIASSGPITVGIPLIFAKIIRRKKTVFEVRDMWPEGAIQMGIISNRLMIKFARCFERLCYSASDLIVTASPGMTNAIVLSGIQKSISTFPNASDLRLFQSKRAKPLNYDERFDGKKLIIYTGSLGYMDECETAIRAMAEFRDKNLALVIIGDGVKKPFLEELANEIGSDNVFFLGLIPKLEVANWYAIADASLVGFENYPILKTCSPNKMFDSFAAGVPIIQNTEGWIKDLLLENGGGVTVRYKHVDDYVQAYKQIITGQLSRQNEGLKAFQLATELFDRDIIANDYLTALKKLMKKS